MSVNLVCSENVIDGLNKLKQMFLSSNFTLLDEKNVAIVFDDCYSVMREELKRELSLCGAFNGEVFSFSKFCDSFKDIKNNKKLLKGKISVLNMHKAILRVKPKLKAFYDVANEFGFAETTHKCIEKLINAGITPNMLNENKNKSPKYILNRIEDICIIYSEFLMQVEKNYMLPIENYDLVITSEKMLNFLRNANVYIFSSNEIKGKNMEFLQHIIKNSKSVCVQCLCPIDGKYSENPVYCDETFRTIEKFLLENKISYQSINAPTNSCAEFNHIKKYLFNFLSPNRIDGNGVVRVARCNDINEEVNYVCSRIKLDAYNGTPLNKIAIVCDDLFAYFSTLKNTFENYGLNVDLKQKVSVANSCLYQYFETMFKVKYSLNLSLLDVVCYMQNILTGYNASDVATFENYCLKHGIAYSQLNTEFKFKDNMQTVAENIRLQFAKDVSELNNIETKDKSFFTFSNSMLTSDHFMKKINLSIELYISRGMSSCAANLKSMYFNIVDIIMQVKEVFENENLSAHFYLNLIKAVAEESEIQSGVLARNVMNASFVKVVTSKEAKLLDVDCVYILGANDKFYPSTSKDNSIIPDDSIIELITSNNDYCSVIESNRNNKLNTFLMIITPKVKVEITVARVLADGKSSSDSLLLNELNEIFADTFFNVKDVELEAMATNSVLNGKDIRTFVALQYPTKKQLLLKLIKQKQINKFVNNKNYSIIFNSATNIFENCLQHLLFCNANEIMNIEEGHNKYKDLKIDSPKELFFTKKTVSATQLERFFSCPFKHFLSNGLKLFEREEKEFSPIFVGDFLHAVAEKYILMSKKASATLNNGRTNNQIAKEICLEVFKSPKFYDVFCDEKFQSNVERLTKEGQKLCDILLYGINNSNFECEAVELALPSYEANKGLVIDDANKIMLAGRVDRVDIWKDYVRIIDYKTGSFDVGGNALYSGNSLQLYLYMKWFLSCGKKAGGSFYLPIHDEIEKENFNSKNDDGDEKDATFSSSCKMQGIFVDDVNVVGAMDINVAKGESSKIMKAKLKKDGNAFNLNITRGNVPELVFQAVCDYAFDMSKYATANILQGNVTCEPFSEACRFCNYKNICCFDKNSGMERIVEEKIDYNKIYMAVNNGK